MQTLQHLEATDRLVRERQASLVGRTDSVTLDRRGGTTRRWIGVQLVRVGTRLTGDTHVTLRAARPLRP